MKLTKAIMIRSAVMIIVIFLLCISCNDSPKKVITPAQVELHNVEPDSISFALEQVPEQLVHKRTLSANDLYRDYDGDSQLKDYFLIELIDIEMFEEARRTSVNYLITDTTVHKKVDGVLRLPLQKGGELIFSDDTSLGESFSEYTYIGQIEPLNMYLTWVLLWEDWHYSLLDKAKGVDVQSFLGLPYLSADQKYIVCIDIDSAEGMSIIGLYTVASNEKRTEYYIDPVVQMYAKSWIPIDTIHNMFWSTDGYVYVQVAHNANYWDAGNNFGGLEQYIRIKPIVT